MKRTLLKRKIQACYLHKGLFALAVNIFLASTSLAQLDDTRIAFMSTRSERNSEIFVMNPDGKRVRRLTEHPQYDAVPAWSPDGQKITFMSLRDEHRIQAGGIILGDIYVMNPDGANPINLTQSVERPDGVSSWSPDGKQIAFYSDRNWDWKFEVEEKNWEIFVMSADGTNLINLTNHLAKDSSPDWSPDGQQIAFTSSRDENREVYVMNADGTNPINLTNHLASDGSPDWSPDGNQIAFQSNRDGNWEIYIMNADGANPINLTQHPAWDSSPSWGSVRPLRVSSNGRLVTLWAKVKHSNTYRVK